MIEPLAPLPHPLSASGERQQALPPPEALRIVWDGDVCAKDAAVVRVLRPAADALAPTPRDLAEAPRGSRREAFLRRRAATRRFVAERLGVAPEGVEIGHDPQGAPRLFAPSAGLRLSISGRADFCALALAQTLVGVDIEPLEAALEPVWSALNKQETAHLQSLARAAQGEAFLRLWTAKEAYLKALGEGFSRDLADIAISPEFDVIDTGRVAPVAARGWRGVELDGAAFIVACVALTR